MTWCHKFQSKGGHRCFLLAVFVGALGCGGGATFDGNVVRGPKVSYRIESPGDGWRELDVTDNHVAWKYARRPSSVIQVNGRCDEALDIPLEALRSHLLIGFTDREFHSEDRIDLDAREALRTQVSAKLDGVERRLNLVVLKKNGCVYDFSLIASNKAEFNEAQTSFDRVLSSFRSEP